MLKYFGISVKIHIIKFEFTCLILLFNMAIRKCESEKYMYSSRLTSKIAPKSPASGIHTPSSYLSKQQSRCCSEGILQV